MLNAEWFTPQGIRELKERAQRETLKIEARHRALRLGMLALFLFSPLQSVPERCNATYLWVAEMMFPRRLESGVEGKNTITVPQFLAVDNLWVNSIWVYKDQDNWVEIGWYAWQGGNGEKHWNIFGRRAVGEEYLELFDLPATPERDYGFQLTKISDTQWEFKITDLESGSLLHDEAYYALLDSGYPIAQQERHNSCLGGETHWWDLGYWSGFNWHPWRAMGLYYDNDPDYEVIGNTATEFWVERPINSNGP